MAPPPSNPKLFTWHLCFLLLVFTATLSAAASPYQSVCSSLTPPANRRTDSDDALSLTRSFQISTGHFTGGDNLFSPDDDDDLYNYRSFSLFPHGAFRTNDPALVHLTATLTVTGPRNASSTYRSPGRRHRYNYTMSQSISFVLDGYYSNTSHQLCMVGSGTELAADGSLKHYSDVVLRLRVPSPPKLNDPLVSGSLEGSSDFGTVNLLAYAEGDNYKYAAERAPCGSPPTTPVRGTLQALGGGFSCAHLKEQLMTSYKLEHGGVADTSTSASSPLLRMLPRMHINQMQCTADGAVRAYMVFSNNTGSESRQRRVFHHYGQHRVLVDEEAVVADGHWNSTRGVLCLRACPVVRSAVTSARKVSECGIGISFWFPAAWTMRDRSLVAGMLWNSSQAGNGNHGDAGQISGVISASSIDTDNQRSSNLSDVKYNYNDTMIEEAKKHYMKIKKKQQFNGLFPGNLTYNDFELRFYSRGGMGSGEAYPVTIGSVMVQGDRLAADNSVSVVDTKQDLLNVSYDIRHFVPSDDWVRPPNVSLYSYTMQERRISAEGVYDPKRGIMSMVGCRELNVSTDCQILVTLMFAPLDARAQEYGRGAISSLRDNKNDPLFFEKIDIHLYGMYMEQVSEAISRMDLESIMLVASTTLSCVFTVLQILHTMKNPEAAPATSITMLAILTLGYLTPLVLNFEALFVSRRTQYYTFSRYAVLELKEVMMRAPMLIAFVLQLRLIQLVWSGRRGSADQSKSATAPPSASERIVLQICLPLYLLGGVLAGIVHVVNVRAAREDSLVVRIGGEPATIWEDLVSYAGLILDGFLLPQIILNASLAGSGVRAISPWFYMGGTMIRAMPHVYDVVRARVYEPSISPSDVYASPRSDLFGVAWDIVIPCGAALLALLLFLQQRLGGSQRRRSGGYEMVSNL